jgi:uncharacterized membrane protein
VLTATLKAIKGHSTRLVGTAIAVILGVAFLAGIEAVLGPDSGAEVLTGEEITEETQDAIAENLAFFNTFLTVFAVIALFVSRFVIYNTFAILVAQRTRELALFRALGASRRQVVGSVLLRPWWSASSLRRSAWWPASACRSCCVKDSR